MHFFPKANAHKGCETSIDGCPEQKNEHVVRGDASILIRVATWRLSTVVKHRLTRNGCKSGCHQCGLQGQKLGLVMCDREMAVYCYITGRLGLNDRRFDGTSSINGVFG